LAQLGKPESKIWIELFWDLLPRVI
jgi:hypothetical protein